MSNLLGVIRAVIGQVYVIETDGSQRLLKEGDRIYSGEEIVTGSSGAVSVSLPDGKTLDLGRNSHWTEHGLTAVNSTEHDAQDVASLQKAIADGADPTQSLEATAAGNETPAPIVGGGGGHTHVQLELTGEIIDPTAGFKTQGLGAPTWTHELPEGARTAGSPPVLPPLVHIDDFAGNDGFINKNEINHATINGTSNQNHVTLTFTDSQKNTLTIEVDVKNGHWTTQPDLSGLAEGEITVIATATDVSGRTAVSTAEAQIDTLALHDNITIDNVTADNVINIAESHYAQTSVHGTVSGDARIGDKITLTVNGHEYTDVVIDLGNGVLGYRIDVSTQGLLADPNIHATVTSTDEAGNTIQVSSDHHVEIDLDVHNTLSIQTVAGDDTVNTAESRMPTMITGVVGGDAHEGDPVTVTVGGRDFHGVVVNDNGQLHYEVSVPTQLLKEGANDVQVQLVSHDAAGNEAIAIEHKTVTLDTQAHNALTIDTVATDNVVNAAESRMPTLISGEVTGDAQVGDHVVVSVNGQSFYGAVTADENGHLRYEVPVPTDALNEGSNDVQVMVTGVDNAGNTAIAVEHKTVVLDTQAHNALTIDTVATDNVVNASESRMPTLISGAVTGDAQVGDHVVVSVNGKEFYGAVTVDENDHLRYEVPVPTNALSEGSNDVQVMVTGVDDAGNTAIAVEHKTVTLDTQTHNALTIDTVATDNVVNAAESRMPTLISGAVTGDAQVGDHVVVSVNGKEFYGAVIVDENGHLRYEVPVPTDALSEGSNDVQVMVTGVDDVGNTAIAVEHKTVTLDTLAHNALTIDTVAGDNTVNMIESRMPTFISGEVTGDAQAGDKVVVSVNGKEFYGAVTVDENGHLRYEVPVPTNVLSEGSNDLQVMVTGVDDAGNTTIAVEHQTVTLDTQAHNSLTIDTVASDNTVNAAESRMPTLISGVVTGDAQVGDHVVVSINGKEFYGAVTVDENGHLRYEVPVPTNALSEGSNAVQVMVTGVDDAGNTAIAVEHKTIVLDTQAHNALTIDIVATDNVVNASESRMPTFISGEVTGDAQVGDHVVVSVNGKEFYGAVSVDENGHLRYEVPVPTDALSEGSNAVQVMVTGVDNAGNTAIAVEHQTIVLDTQAHNALTIDIVAGDNTVNAAESRMPTLISGAVTGDAQVGDHVVVSVNGKEFYGAVTVDENGHLRYEVPVPTDALSEGSNDVQVMVTGVDDAGNTAIAVGHQTVTLDTQAHNALTIDTVAGDNTVNMIESRMPTFISGEVTGDAQAGDKVVVSVNGKESYGAVTVDENGHLRYEVPVPTNALSEGSNDVQVMVTGVDDAGNTAIAIEHKTVTLDTQAKATLSIDSVTDDNVLNHTEMDKTHQLISGVVGGDARKGDIVELDINGHKYTGNVIELSDGKLGYQIPVDSSAFSDNQGEIDTDVKFTVRVTSHDKAGNEVIQTTEHTVHIDNHANNGMTINTVAGDNVVNKIESEGPTHITGIVNGPDAKAGDHVVVRVDGHDFKGEVFADARGRLHYDVAVHTDLLHEGENDVLVTVTSHDGVGNEAVATEHKTVTLDTHAKATITIDDVTKDNVLNHTELDKAHQMISGVVDGDARKGDVIELDINGHKYTGNVIELSDGTLGYQIPVDSSSFSDNQGEVDTDVKIIASVTAHDKAGNEVTQTTDHTVHIDNHANNGVTIHTVAGDNIVSFKESQHDTLITGDVTGPDAKAGDVVEVRLDGHVQPFFGKVSYENGHLVYKVAVPSGALKEGGNNLTVTVTSHDKVGNEAIATEHHHVTLDTHADASITVDRVTKDNTLSHAEMAEQKHMITGTVGGDAHKGDVVILDFNGNKYTGHVIEMGDGTLGYKIPVDSSAFGDNNTKIDGDVKFTASVTSHDAVNNEVTVTTEHTVHVDNFAVTGLTMNTVSGDGYVNAKESAQDTLITGGVSGDAKEGDPVVVTVNNQTFAGVVENDHGHLRYEVSVPTSALHEGKNDVVVTLTSFDALGNEAIATEHKNVTLDTHADATITLNGVTDDNILNHHELAQPKQTITGTVGGDAKVGDIVTLEINGHTYSDKVVDLDGKGHLGYHIAVDSSAFGQNSEGEIDRDVKFTASVTSHDAAHNEVTVTTEHTVHIDNHANNAITINTVSGDDWVSAAESNSATFISGDVSGTDAKVGDPVVVNVWGHNYNGKVVADAHGNLHYEVAIPRGVLHEGDNAVKVTVTSVDAAHNVTHAVLTHNVSVDTHADATISIDSVTDDNILNHDELATPMRLVSGVVGGDAKLGDTVNLEINGHHYSGDVIDLGHGKLGYQIPVDSSAFSDNQGKIDTNVTITASIISTDHLNNVVTATTEHTVHIDNHAEAGITMDIVSGDNTINQLEAKQHTTKVSGTVSGDDVHEGDKIIVTVNGHNYETTVEPQPHLNGALGYSLNVLTKDVLADQNITAHIVGHDSVGNQQLAEVTTTMTVDREAVATITIDPVTANHDNMINGKESQSEFTDVTGSVGGDAKEGDLVTLHINGIDYTGRVDANHQYKISVSTHDLMTDKHITASVTATDQANNVATAHATQDIIVDTQAIAHISVDSVTDDNTLDGEELNHRYSLVTGKVSGEMQAGDPLTLNINGHEYHGTVETLPDGKLGYEILVETRDIHTDPTILASISVTDAAGNSVTATDNHQVNIDDHADASLTINIVSGDDVLNQHDQESDTTTINGRVGGDVKSGDVVVVTVDGQVYHATVGPQTFLGGGLGYSIAVSTQGLLNNPHIVATVDAKDVAGNTITAGATHNVSSDDHAYATVTIDRVTDDNTINNAEAHEDHTTITGHVTGDVHAGDQVDLTVNGQHYYGYVSDKGTYNIEVSTADLISGDHKPDIHASVMGADAAGNTLLAEFDRVVNIDTRADAEIKIGSLELNSSRDFWVIEGTVGGDAKEGDVVKIFAGGKTYETTVQRYPDGHLGFSGDHLTDPVTGQPVYINAHDLDNNADVSVQITSTDPYGNTETATAQVQANVPGGSNNNNGTDHNGGTTTPHHGDPHATITINTVAGDNTINQTESQSPTTVVRGTVSGDVQAGDHVTVHVGGKDYDCIVSELPNLPGELGYEANVDTKDLMANPNITANVTAHNGGTVTHVFDAQTKVQVDTDVNATIQLDKIAGDNTINIAEATNGTTTISGTVTGDGVHDGSNVTLMVNGYKITTQVHEDPTTGVMTFSKEVSIDDLRQTPQVTASVDGHDDKGNVITVSNDVTVTVDTDVSAHVTIDNVTSDNVLNLNETLNVNTDITGTVSGDVEQGDHVKITVNHHEYDAVVDGNKNYKVSVLTSDLAQGKTITAEVTGHDAAQNSVTVTETHGLSVDTVAEGSITINTVSGDNILSANDLSAKTTEISGVVGKDARIGDEVTITLNGHKTSVTVGALADMNGQLGYTMQVNTADLKAELDAELKAHPNEQPHITVTVSGKDDAGNDFSQSESRPVTIDDHADVALNINDVTDDNVLNSAESKQALTEISGTVSGDVHVGNNVIVHVNGNDLIVPIEKDASGNLTFSVKVPTSDMLQNPQITYTVTGTDAVGNTVIVSENNTITVDQTASNSIHVDTVAGDDRVNIKESGQPTTHVTGTITGDAHAGDPVTLTVNGNTFTSVVADHDGKLTYDITVDTRVLKEGENTVEVHVAGKDAAGNPAESSATHIVTLDTHIDASITINPVAGDNIINAKESDHIVVTGKVDGDARDGDKVTLDVNGHTIETKVKMIDGHLGYDVKVDKDWLQDGTNSVHVSVKVRDDAGNTTTAYQTQHVKMDTHADATVTINKVTGDNHLNAHELHQQQTHITGQVEGDVHDGSRITATVNGHEYSSLVHDVNGHLTYDIAMETTALHTGLNNVNVSVVAKDTNGNTKPVLHEVDVTVAAEHHNHHDHGLSKLFDDSHDSLTFDLHHPEKDHHSRDDHQVFSGKTSGDHEKIDLSDLAHELHEGADITQLIKGGNAHDGKGDAAHSVHTGGDHAHLVNHDAHGSSSYSLDHLIAKPDHYSH